MGSRSTPKRSVRARDEDRLDRVFGALADRTRRGILARLEAGPASITDLAAPLTMSFPAVSKHVRVLEDAGLVRRSVEGRVHRCAIEPAPLARADEFLATYRPFWESTLDSLADFVEEK
jgi:DNA-binding transcriptional ArsR family regulator